MQAPAARLRAAVDDQPRNRIQLVSQVEPERSDRRLVRQTRTNRIAQIVQIDVPRAGPHIADVEKEHASKAPAQWRAELLADGEHAVAAERDARFGQRADLVAAPSSNARGAA